MSNYNFTKTVLGTALAVAMVAGTASAATITFGATRTNHAFEVTNLTSGSGNTKNPLATRDSTMIHTLASGDALVGKTAADELLVRVTFTGANCGAAPTNGDITHSRGTVSAVTCAASANVLEFKLVPTGTLAIGDTLTFATQKLAFADASGLNALDGVVSGSIAFLTFGGANNVVQAAQSATILQAKQSSKITLAAATTAKTTAASNGKQFEVSGGATSATSVTLATITTNATSNSDPVASAFGAGATFTDNISGANNFQFDANGTASITASTRDRLDVEVIFENASGISQVYMQAGACTAGTKTAAAGSIAVFSKATNTYTGSIDLTSATTESLNVCGIINTTDDIKNQAVTTKAKYDLLVGRDTAYGTAVTTSNFEFEGTAVDVLYVNPAANTAQVSFIRVSNTNTVASGLVTINGTCDNGTALTQVTFTLPAKESKVFTATQLEQGGNGLSGGMGACSGTASKTRLNVKSAFQGAKVQSFLRNINSSGTTTVGITRDQ